MPSKSSWADSRWAAKVVFVALALALPGLLQLSALPVAAEVQQVEIEVPRQQRGNFGVAPALVEASVTQPDRNVPVVTDDSAWLPKDALGPDRLYAGPRILEGTAPPGLIPYWDGVERSLASRAAERQASAAADDAPSVWSTHPVDGLEIDTLTPQLRLEAYHSGLALPWDLERRYEVCEVTSTGGTGPCTTSPWLGWTDPYWTVPAGKLQWGKTYTWDAHARDAASGATSGRTDMYFTTGVRQPLVSSLLATSGVSGQEFHQVAGNYTTDVTDASVAGAGAVPLAVMRSYNSLDRRAKAMFGSGWSTRFDMKIDSEGGAPESLLLTYPDGRQLRFVQHAGKNTYQSPPGMHFTLTKQTGGGWKLMDKQSSVYDFDAEGQLLKVADSRGRGQQLSYTGGKLTKVTADGGRSLTFAWTGDHVTQVSTDPVDGAPLVWTYHYDGDRLARVCAPGQDAECIVYTYDNASRYRETVLDSRPANYFRLGEVRTAGTARCFPDEADALDCRTFGSGVLTGQPGALSGTTNAAVTFQGSGRSSHFETGPMLPKLSAQVSIEAWFKTTKSGFIYWAKQGGYGMGDWTPANPGYGVPGLYVGTDGKLRGMLTIAGSETGGTPVASQQTVNDGQWHHAVITSANELTTLYVDGTTAGSGPGGVEEWNWVNGSVIGTGGTYSSLPGMPTTSSQAVEFGFQGSIDEVAFYNRALTAAEVRTHYEARAAAAFSLSKVTLASGRTWMANTYDAASGRLATHTDPDGGTWKVGVPVLDWAKRVSRVTVTDPFDKGLTFEYDPWRGYRQVSVTDQTGAKTTYTYDTGGFTSEIIDPNNNKVTKANDARGNLISTLTCETASKCHTVRAEYYVNTSNELDPRNDRVTKVRDARSTSSSDNTYLTTFEYNAFGEQTKQTTPATPDFPSGRSATTAYTDGTEAAVGGGTTPAGLVKSETDYRGKTTTYAYTAAGDQAEVRSPAGLVIKYTHDPLGRVASKTEVSSAHPDGITTTFTYDGESRVLSHKGTGVKNEVSGVTHTAEVKYAYDLDGNPLTETASDLTGGDPARTVTYTYDDFGRVETVTGPEGGEVTYTYNLRGDQSSTVDELGNHVEYGYNARGRLWTTTLKGYTGSPVSPQPATDVVVESYSYDPGGRLAAVVDAMGRKTSYTYHGNNRLHKVTAEGVKLNGATTTRNVVLEENTYDAAGNLTKVVGGGGIERMDYVVDAADRVTSETYDPASLARKTAYVYDANGNLTKATRTKTGTSRAEAVEFAYNDDDVLTRRTVENGDQDLTTSWKVDERGLILEEVDPRGNVSGADAAGFTTHYRYDAAGRLVETKSPEVKVEKYGAEAKTARPTMRFGYDTTGNRTHEVDESGDVTTSAYDRLGRLLSITGFPYQQPGGQSLTPVEKFEYNPAGQVTKYTDERGSTWSTEYDALGNRVRVTEPAVTGKPAGQWTYEYNLAGELLAAVDPTGARVESTYDDLGRTITATVLERKPAAEAFVTNLEYSDAGARLKEVGPLNRTTTWVVNAAGEITKETDPAGNATSYDYDLAGRPTKVTNALNNSTITEYDLAGRQIAIKETDDTGKELRATAYGYDAAGNETSESTPEGHTIRSVYDATDLLTELVEPVTDGKSITTTYGYDVTGSLTRATDGRGNTFWTAYNSLGLAEKTIEPATAAHPAEAGRTWTYVYDAGGNMTAALQPGGVRIDHAYDALGRITRQTGSGAEAATPEWTFDYDARGRSTVLGDYTLDYNDRGLLTKIAKGGTQTAAFTYDAYGNPIQKQDVNGTSGYGWDAADRLKTFTDAVSGRSLTYDYDNADRLKTLTSANPGGKQELDYDDLDRITAHTLRNAAENQMSKITYDWDKNDNLTKKVTADTAGAGDNTYTYDRSDRMTSWTGPDGTKTTYEWDDSGNRVKVGDTGFVFDERNRLLSGGGTQYTYTPRGTLATETTGGATRQLKFDAFDNLVSDGDATYTYDNLGRVITRTQGGVEERFVYASLDNDMVAVTDPAGAAKARFGRDPDGNLVGLAEGGVKLGVLSDQHDDVVATFSGDALVDSTAYNPFGEVTASSGTKRRLGYQGEYTDPATGKVNMASRWYIPGTGGFASRDDYTIDPYPSINLNRYTYAGGNPLAYTDPSGNCPFCIPLLFAAVRVAAQMAIRALARPVVKQVVKQAVRQTGKQVTKQATKQTTKQVTKQTTKKTTQQTTKKTTQQAKKQTTKQTTRKPTTRTTAKKPVRPVVKTPKVKTPKVKTPKAKTPKVKTPKTKTKTPKTKTPKTKTKTSKTTKPTTSKTKTPKKTQSTTRKNEIAQEATQMVLDEVGIADFGSIDDSDFDFGYDGGLLCRSLRSCAKDVVEEIRDNIADKVIEEIVEDTIPSLPIDPPGAGVSCALPNSFIPGTLVLMADGSRKPIEQIEAGEEVLATDPATGRTEPRPVTTLITSKGVKNLVDITVTADGKSDVLTATDAHPFWVPKQQAWVDAGDLKPGMWLRTAAGTYVQISAIHHRTAPQRVHNLTIEDLHTYHVVVGAQAVLVHNDGDPRFTCAADGTITDNDYSVPTERYNRKKHYGGAQTNGPAGRAARSAGAGQPCPVCYKLMTPGTKQAPIPEHEPPLMFHYYLYGGKDMSEADRKAYAKSGINGSACATCQRQQGADMSKISKRIVDEFGL